MGYIKSSTHQQKLLRKAHDGKICGAQYFDRRAKKHFVCEKAPMDNGKCDIHGGKSVKALDHPNTKSGKFSKYMPTNLLSKYEEFLDSDEIQSLNSDIAVIEARIAMLLENYDENMIASNDLKELNRCYKAWQQSKGDNRDTKQEVFEEKLKDITIDHNFWMELTQIIDKKRKLVKTESQKKKLLDQYIPVDSVLLLFNNLTHIVEDELNSAVGGLLDEDLASNILEKIGKRFNRVINKKKK